MLPTLAFILPLALQPLPQASPLPTFESRLSLESWHLPQGGAMGMVGLQVQRSWDSGAYAGLGGWGAVRGDYGGFILLGASGGWRLPLTRHLGLDAGLWMGGGGIQKAGVGSGLTLRGHLEATWQAPWGRMGVGLARVQCPQGSLASTQATFSATLPFRLAGADTPPELWPSLGWRPITLLASAQRYGAGSRDRRTLDLAGLEARLGLGEHSFAFVDLSGSARGGTAGYMDVFGGLGASLPLSQDGRLALTGRLGLGPAGGGAVEVGGGLTWKALLGLEGRTRSGLQAGLGLGRIASPGGSFRGTVLQVQLGRRFEVLSPGGTPADLSGGTDWSRWGIELAAQGLSAPQRKDGSAPPVQLASLQVLHELGGPLYLLGQGNAAVGGRSGSYAAGLLGLGLSSAPFWELGPRLQAQVLVGAGGGGGLATGGGFLWQPSVGLEQDLCGGWGLRAQVGRCIATQSALSSPLIELGAVYRTRIPVRSTRR
nr:hypothetical protein [uncultured Holophaga sp.]